VLAMVLAACAAPAATTAPPATPSAGPPAYETFDPAGYEARSPAGAAEVEHDVPPRLMEGRVEVPDRGPAAPTSRVVDGFRIQLFSSEDRAAAERVRGAAEAWSRSLSGSGAGMRGEVAWLQPYYRVRLGAFASRAEAEEALAAVRTEYPEAFLVPDLVTVSN